jgi:rhodanese-related sulfurtransferase
VDDRNRKSALFDELAVVGKAFASAKRLEIIDLLGQRERTVEALAKAAGLGVSTASAHLQILKLANLVHTRREGTRIFYRLAGDDVAALYTALGTVARDRSADVERARAAYLGLADVRDVEEVTREELHRRLGDADTVVLDVRPAEEYEAGHIPGAVSMPFGDLAQRMAALDAEADIVAYCRGAYCVMAHDAVRLLRAEGRHARRLEDGLLEWRLAGLPVEAA